MFQPVHRVSNLRKGCFTTQSLSIIFQKRLEQKSERVFPVISISEKICAIYQ